MIARVVDNVLSSNARPILVVTGHQAEQVAARAGRPAGALRPCRRLRRGPVRQPEGRHRRRAAGVRRRDGLPRRHAAGDRADDRPAAVDLRSGRGPPDRAADVPRQAGQPDAVGPPVLPGDPADHRRFRRPLPARQAHARRWPRSRWRTMRCCATSTRPKSLATLPQRLRPEARCGSRAALMPICEADPWRFQYFENVACPDDVRISTEDPDSWKWYPATSLDLRQTRGRVVARAGRRAARRDAAGVPGVLQADHEPARHGHRQPGRSHSAEEYTRGADRRAFLVHAADRRACQHRRRAGGRRAALVAPHHRRHRAGRHVRLLAYPRRGDAGDRGLVRRLGAQASARLHRHGEFRDHRRPHHRGASALRRPMA